MIRHLPVIHTIYLFIILTWMGSQLFGQEQAFGLEEKPGQYLPEVIEVINEDGVEVNMRELIDKPTLLCFVYYHCPALCPKTLAGIAELVDQSESVPGKDYQVFVLSIDPSETSEQARKAKNQYTERVSKPINPYFWRFFTADSATIRRLTDVTGWEYRQVDDNFVHTTSSILISPEGMISQYFYGTYFNWMHFDMGVQNAWKEQVTPTRLKTLKYCYNYKPPKNKKVDVITKLFGISVILIVVSIFLYLVRGSKPTEKK